MKCEEFVLLLPSYPDGIDSTKLLSDIQKHAAECPDCAARLSQQEQMLGALKTLDESLQLPEAFSMGWREAVRLEPPPERISWIARWQTWATAAAAVLLVTFGITLVRGGWLLPPAGPDQQSVYSQTDLGGIAGTNTMSFAEPQMNQARVKPQSLPQPDTYSQRNAAQKPVILYTASLTINSECYDEDVAMIELLLESAGGWMEYHSVYGEALEQNPNGGRYASMTFRVPMEELGGFVDAVSGIGRLMGSESTAEDISDQYYDTEARLEMYKAQRDRMKELLAQAENMTDIIEIESRMSELQYTIEGLMGTLNNWNSRAENAIVRVSVTEVPAGGTHVPQTIWERLRAVAGDSVRSAGEFLMSALVFLVMAAPYLVVIALIVVIIVLAIGLKKKHSPKKRSNEEE